MCLSFIGALTVIPHVHGNDLDHSTHQSCPVYQIGFHFPYATVGAIFAAIVTLGFTFISLRKTVFFRFGVIFDTRLRSPPVIF